MRPALSCLATITDHLLRSVHDIPKVRKLNRLLDQVRPITERSRELRSRGDGKSYARAAVLDDVYEEILNEMEEYYITNEFHPDRDNIFITNTQDILSRSAVFLRDDDRNIIMRCIKRLISLFRHQEPEFELITDAAHRNSITNYLTQTNKSIYSVFSDFRPLDVEPS